jgi:hypothetical protein
MAYNLLLLALVGLVVGLHLVAHYRPSARRARAMRRVSEDTEAARREVMRIAQAAQTAMIQTVVEGRARREREQGRR